MGAAQEKIEVKDPHFQKKQEHVPHRSSRFKNILARAKKLSQASLATFRRKYRAS
jgi:hypothetical protein